LEVDLQRRLDERQAEVSWPDPMRDLEDARAVEITLDDIRYRLRTDLHGSAHQAFAAAGSGRPRWSPPWRALRRPSPREPTCSGKARQAACNSLGRTPKRLSKTSLI
jgi:hypothetical protein